MHGTSATTISIITPTFDRLPLLEEAIRSVRAQTYGNWEMLVVDDGSRDATVPYVRGLDDERIRLISSEHTGNIARLRNTGLSAARGRYVAFLDSDDLWLPDKLAIQLHMMRETGVRWSYTGYTLTDGADRTLETAGQWKPAAGWIAAELLTTAVGAAISTLMVDRDLIDTVGLFDENPWLIFREDYELMLRLALAAEAGVVDMPLAHIREHAGRSTHGCSDPHERSARVYERFLERTDDRTLRRIARSQRSRHLAEAVGQYLAHGEYRRAAAACAACLSAGGLRFALSAVRRGMAKAGAD